MSDPPGHRHIRKTASVRDAALMDSLFDVGIRAVDLMLTTRCNLRCTYCPQARGLPREMPTDVVTAAIGRLVTSRLVNPALTLFGGEPLLSPRLVRFTLDQVRTLAPPHMRPSVRIITNGLRLDEEMTRLLVRRRVHITLSLDGVAPAQDDRAPGSFAILDRLLARLRRDHPEHFRNRLAVQATLTSRNVRYLSQSFRYLVSRGIADIPVVPVIPDDAGWGPAARRMLDEQLGEVVQASIEEFRRTGKIPFRAFRGKPDALSPADGPSCGWGRKDALFVDVDGSIAPCSVLAPSVLAAPRSRLSGVLETLGGVNVLDSDLPAALVRRERRAKRLNHLVSVKARRAPRRACAACAIRRSCFVCPVAVSSNGGRVPAIHCDVNRLFARQRAEFLHCSERFDCHHRSSQPNKTAARQ